MDIPDWLSYEYQVVKHHQENYDEIVWHHDIISEEHLINAGFIHNMNKFRLKRIAINREKKGNIILYSDYGMDFLSLDKNKKYHAGQVKHYTSRKIYPKDIATFMMVSQCRIKTPGYLYTSGKVCHDIRDDFKNSPENYIHYQLSFDLKQENVEFNEGT